MGLHTVRATLALVVLAAACTTAGDGTGAQVETSPAPPPPAMRPEGPPPAPSPEIDLAPDFTLPTFDGATFRLSSMRGQMPVLLHFWAPW